MPKQFNWKAATLIIALVGILTTVGIFAFNNTVQIGEQKKEVSRLRIDLDTHIVDSNERFKKLDNIAEDIATIKGYLEAMKENKSNTNRKHGQ